jgi:hypothetical protein
MRNVAWAGEKVGPGEDTVKFGSTSPSTVNGRRTARKAFAP